MNSSSIRQKFLDFFASKGHEIVKSAPIVVKDDPTLMFINAGMNPFKDWFLGNEPAKSPRVTDAQKCLRVSGKHNDLEEVGVDTYHHTLFEMLGNWSFGDYFKQEAIDWAWELLTKEFGVDKDSLYITVFGGDEGDGLSSDEEARGYWKKHISEDRILDGSKKDNFWEMGDTGPCGPCSEIHIDIRSAEEKAKVDGKSLVNEDHPQVIEIWNLVFMQYNRMANGKLVPLPATHVDTGMGFERLCMVLQGKQSNYDTDVFTPLLSALEKITTLPYERTQSQKDIAFRVISDHVRAVAFSIADGQLPSNNGAGYVIRRILRRAVRYGYSFLNMSEPFIYLLVDVLNTQMGAQYEEIPAQLELIKKVIKEEEEAFLRTLDRGIKRMDDILSDKNLTTVPGKVAFELYDTFGFPFDLTSLICREKNVKVDEAGFQAELQAQKDRSRNAQASTTTDWVQVHEGDSCDFVGYDRNKVNTHVLKYREVQEKKRKYYQIVLASTPLYPEGGGQVGDTGVLFFGDEEIVVTNTKKENNLIVHITDKLPSNPSSDLIAKYDGDPRKATAANHSGTHLLHFALREVLGTHVEQKGSLVNSEYLRFDFSHFEKVTPEQIVEIEQRVNYLIRRNIALQEFRQTPIEEAKAMGALALFGEKYGDTVRVIQFEDSVELCGGTHVKATGQIGFAKITSESSVAAGIRRIEMITGNAAENWVREQQQALDEIKEQLKAPKNLAEAIAALQTKNAQLQKEMEGLMAEKAKNLSGDLLNKIKDKNGIRLIAEKINLPADSIKNIAFEFKKSQENLVMLLGSEANGKATISVMVSDDLVSGKNMHAGKLVKELAKEIQGGGGGQAFFATAGGKNPGGLTNALLKIEELI